MHPADINALIIKKGLNQRKIAAHFGVSRAHISQVVHGKYSARRIALYISKVTGRPVSELWPGRYDKQQARRRAA